MTFRAWFVMFCAVEGGSVRRADAGVLRRCYRICESGVRERRGELDQLAAGILGLVQQLDGMNMFRFRDDPEKLAAWISARDIPRPARKPPVPEGPPPAVAS